MKVSKQKKVQEAVKRMKALGLIDEVIKQFEKNGTVCVSEPPMGAVFSIPDDNELKQAIVAFEKEHNALVYHVVRSYTEIGQMDSYLYVSDNEQEWEMDMPETDDIFSIEKDFYVFAYVENVDDPNCSEFGEIMVRLKVSRGLVRIA